jgi:hypothetical protein
MECTGYSKKSFKKRKKAESNSTCGGHAMFGGDTLCSRPQAAENTARFAWRRSSVTFNVAQPYYRGIGSNYRTNASVVPGDATDKTLKYTSSNPGVATTVITLN